ncbi:MAG TPA: hypothetical protein VFE51_15595 [Verrucomicrobiae bacterium]|nr:hypothetical protein [Verrucomicrobiae bacterium]
MPDRYYNPFQGIDITVPIEFRDSFQKYCQTAGRAVLDQSPFPRMVDMWFLAACLGARLNLEPLDLSKYETYKIIEGSIFGSDPWRIHTLMMIAISKTGDVQIVSEPRRMMACANGLAVAGLPRLLDMLKDGGADPIWNLSESIGTLLQSSSATATHPS